MIQARYAFVIHTEDPTSGDTNQIYAEVCRGLGESLVSDKPGAAFAFTYDKTTHECRIQQYASKPVEITTTSCGKIFRSDSNSEDLPGFAGAGLFDSYVMGDKSVEKVVTYSDDPLFIDHKFRCELFCKIGQIGLFVEQAYDGIAQDIEGVYSTDGQFYLVQTRP